MRYLDLIGDLPEQRKPPSRELNADCKPYQFCPKCSKRQLDVYERTGHGCCRACLTRFDRSELVGGAP